MHLDLQNIINNFKRSIKGVITLFPLLLFSSPHLVEIIGLNLDLYYGDIIIGPYGEEMKYLAFNYFIPKN